MDTNNQDTTQTTTPVEDQAKDKLKKYKPEELLKVFDELLFNGEYREEVRIKGKLSVIFKTRSTAEVMEIGRELDKTSYNLITTFQQERAFQALVYSLVSYNGRSLDGMAKEAKVAFLNKLPLNIIDAISNELGKFDDKVTQACAEGEENF